MITIQAELFQSSKQVLQIQSKPEVNKVISSFLKGNITDPKRIESKNNILIHLFKDLNEAPEVPIHHSCKSCQGRGFNLIYFEIEEIKCPSCKGTGWKISDCTRCNGTGFIGNTPCYTCLDRKTGQGRGTYIYKKTEKHEGKKCLSCGGIGRTKKLIQRESKIKKVIPCTKCDGTGINDKIGTPVVNSELAEKLKLALINKQSEKHLI
jgi:hypothetical protein